MVAVQFKHNIGPFKLNTSSFSNAVEHHFTKSDSLLSFEMKTNYHKEPYNAPKSLLA